MTLTRSAASGGLIPAGTVIRLDKDSKVVRGTRTRILGGTPFTMLTLSAKAAAELDEGEICVRNEASEALVRTLLDKGIAHPDFTATQVTRPSSALQRCDLTVVIPVLNDSVGLEELIYSLRDDIFEGLKVVIVDDGSVPPIEIPAKSAHRGLSILRSETSLGPASARNRGIAAADTHVVVALDADTTVLANWWEILAHHFIDPKVAVVAPRIVGARQSSTCVERYENARSSLDMGAFPALVQPGSPVPYIPSAAMMIHLDRLDRVGITQPLFDEDLHVAEDVDLCWRIAKTAATIRYEPAVHIAHRHRSSLVPWFMRTMFYGTGAGLLASRHPAAIAPAVFHRWSLGAAIGIWSGTPVGLAAALVMTYRSWRRLSELVGDDVPALAAEMVARGFYASVQQIADAALRPWWPIVAFACFLPGPLGRKFRCRVAVAMVLSTIAARIKTNPPTGSEIPSFAAFAILLRLSDLAYGSGVWLSVWRCRSFRALRPVVK